MAEYIKRELAASSIALETDMSLAQARKIIENVPSMDIVCCQDCKYYKELIKGQGECAVIELAVADYDFCNFAEPKEEENENKNN